MLRRDFLLTISLSPFAGALPDSSFAAPPRPPALFIYDERFEHARAFAREAAFGATQRAIRGDITSLWLNELQPRWSKRAETIAGVTTERSLFCLDILARDHSLRVLARRDVASASEQLVAWVIGPSASFKGIA
ncbi:MAG TPA: hypothetical protein PLV61_18055 [Parvularculaceae bacterium]|nr:hypothetical protein [Amphiplicatus sp.]HPE33106.1 hypothetical protein [Parvularculaceae bacterium]HRX39205.1 hypothetical protein [Parvularculaceae bacterium]